MSMLGPHENSFIEILSIIQSTLVHHSCIYTTYIKSNSIENKRSFLTDESVYKTPEPFAESKIIPSIVELLQIQTAKA